jgi:hypothetical protein
MKSLICNITFFYNEKRLNNLYRVIKEILHLNSLNVKIIIHSNLKFDINLDSVSVLYYDMSNIDPYHLSWMYRGYMKNNNQKYDYYLYLEDDILFNNDNFKYWLENYKIIEDNGYNLGFLRIEVKNKEEYVTDILKGEKHTEIVNLKDKKYLIFNRKYCGFWLYDYETFKNFVNKDDFAKIPNSMIREEAASGINSKKTTIIPLSNNVPDTRCKVYHLTNNYVEDIDSPHAKVLYSNSFQII